MVGRRKPEPSVEPVPWERVDAFTVGDVVRPAKLGRKALTGRRAVRVPTMQQGTRFFAPAVLVDATADGVPSYDLHDAVHPDTTRPDTLLCSLTPEKDGTRYRVTDAQGLELGLLHRTPAAKRTLQHDWWLQQPGHPDVVARYHWARGSAKDIAERGTESVVRGARGLVGGVVDSLFGLGAEGGDQPGYTPKPVTWRAEGEEDPVALTCTHAEGVRMYRARAGWLDRRLAFAFAVVREA